MSRRSCLDCIVARYLAVLILGAALSGDAITQANEPTTKPNPVQIENALPGSLDWQLTRVRSQKLRSPWIEGYCSKQSVKAGESIDISVSTDPPRPFKIEIFRTGYYGGRGARLMTTLGPFKGVAHPIPAPGEKN